MKKIALVLAATVLLALLAAGLAGGWYIHGKWPVRKGNVALKGLEAAVTVQYDERGVPHIRADSESDLYHALGFVQAQDRLFQMEMLRRLANGELAEVLGPSQLDSDRLFRTLRLRERARTLVAQMDPASAASQALAAYVDGINQYQASHPAPLEFDYLRIPKRPFTAQDALAVTGYLAFSHAAAFKTEPVLTFVRDQLGPAYLSAFDIDGHPEGGVQALNRDEQAHAAPLDPQASRLAAKALPATGMRLGPRDWERLSQLGAISQAAIEDAGLAAFQGSNAWVVSGKRTQSGKPILAGDPHTGFAVPATWYEAHLSAPGFELYGYFHALNPMALLGHNSKFGWTFTLFENDDLDLVAEKVNPGNSRQVWHQEQWADLQSRSEAIKVKGAADVPLILRSGPHGPIVSDALPGAAPGATPIAMWWAFLETDNPFLEGLYQLNRADTRDKARAAVQNLHAPGLNILWANGAGDIAWWSAAQLPQRPPGVNPLFILDASKGEAEKPGFYNFSFNPQEENPARGYIVSANQQPGGMLPVPGYYAPADRAKRIDDALQDVKRRWTSDQTGKLQLDVCTGYPARMLKLLLPMMDRVATDPNDRAFMEPLQKWDGCYEPNSVAASLFSQLSYELARAVFEDELGPARFQNLLDTPALDHALPLLLADVKSPWWDNAGTPQKESYFETIRVAWTNTLKHMEGLYGTSLVDWSWANTHTLTQVHPLGMRWPLDGLLNVGPIAVRGGREAPNNLAQRIGPAPWAVVSGPSTRRVIDFGNPERALGSNPLGQSGVLFDSHYADQTERYTQGGYARQRLGAADILAHTESKLTLVPKN